MPSTTFEDDAESPSDWAIWSDEIDRGLQSVRSAAAERAEVRCSQDRVGFELVEQALLAGSVVLRGLAPAGFDRLPGSEQAIRSGAQR